MIKKITAFLLAMSMIFSLSSVFAADNADSLAKDRFTDIGNHWARKEINHVADESIFPDNDGKFEPDRAITRSEFVLMLHKALDININYLRETDIKEHYKDVSNDDKFAQALYDLVTADIIDYKNEFRPDDVVLREDLVHFAVNSLEYVTGGDYAMIMIFPAPFEDDADINPAYSNDFIKAKVLKLVEGVGNNAFLPKRAATRAEAATVVSRLVNLLESLKPAEEVQVIPSAEVCGDDLVMKLEIVNNTGKKVTINHSSGQKFDFKLLDADRNILYTWSADKVFIMALTSTEIEPGESAVFTDTIDFGAYKDKAVYMKAYITGKSDDFTVDPDGYETGIEFGSEIQ